MAYDAQNKILDIEKKILAKDQGKKPEPVVLTFENPNASKGNKSANRVAPPK
jgi:hypothetical protein